MRRPCPDQAFHAAISFRQMKIAHGLDDLRADWRYPVVTIGNFDGVHVGHRRILTQTAEIAMRNSGTSVAMTFWPHPAQFFQPERSLHFLTDRATQRALIEETGIDIALIVPFDREFARIEAKDFVREILIRTLRAREIVVGFNFTFGRGKAGDVEFLQKEAERLGCETHVIGPLHIDSDQVVSSTRIRALVREGEVEAAARLLGREYSVKGEVIRGAARGAKIGFPTANLRPGDLIVPAKGVYVARIVIEGVLHPAVVNVGVNPTFGGEALGIETHVLDFSGDLYGRDVEVRFCRRVREEMTFPSVDDLVERIRGDVSVARAFFRDERDAS